MGGGDACVCAYAAFGNTNALKNDEFLHQCMVLFQRVRRIDRTSQIQTTGNLITEAGGKVHRVSKSAGKIGRHRAD